MYPFACILSCVLCVVCRVCVLCGYSEKTSLSALTACQFLIRTLGLSEVVDVGLDGGGLGPRLGAQWVIGGGADEGKGMGRSGEGGQGGKGMGGLSKEALRRWALRGCAAEGAWMRCCTGKAWYCRYGED